MNTVIKYPETITQLRWGSEHLRNYIAYRLSAERNIPPVRRVNGYYIYIDTADSYVGRSIGKLGSIGFPVTALFKHVVRRGMTVIDAGAHIGWYTLLAATLVGPKGLVYSFEPDLVNLAYLSKSVKRNGFPNIILRREALADFDGTIDFYMCPDNSAGHTTIPRQGFKKRIVPCIRLDSFLDGEAQKSVDVLKIDVEGAEPMVLQGGQNLLQEATGLRIFMEYSPWCWREYEPMLREVCKAFEVYQIVWSPFLVRRITLEKLRRLAWQTNLYLRRRGSAFMRGENVGRKGCC